jgi:hypothetical protein
LRIGLQGRIDAVNTLLPLGVGNDGVGETFVPIITPGVRFLNERLFIGLGLGFAGKNVDTGTSETSRSSFSISPMAFYDIVSEPIAALALGGWFNFASLSDLDTCPDVGSCINNESNEFGWGLNLGAQVRGKISPGLAIGGEFGWGFISDSDGEDIFAHGIFGNILFEASVGI